MRILQVANYQEGVGGISVQVKSLRDHLVEDGLICDIISTKGSTVRRIKSFCSILKNGRRYDVFHIHTCSGRGFLPALIGIFTGKLLHRRIVLTYHGGGAEDFFRKNEKWVRWVLKKTDSNIVLSGFIGEIFDRYGIPYTIIPNLLDLDDSQYFKREHILPHFISIRSLAPTYDILCTLKAFQIVQNEIKEATLTILGDGPLRSELELWVETHGLNNVTFMGQVRNEQIYQLFKGADIMVSSSRFDNMPVSILEAFNSGLLVIASNVGGIPFMIKDGENGFLFPSGDSVQMAMKMKQAILCQEESKLMIQNARASLHQYSWVSIRDKLLKLYSHGTL